MASHEAATSSSSTVGVATTEEGVFEKGEWFSPTHHEAKFGSRFTSKNGQWFKWQDKWTVRRLKEVYAGKQRADLDCFQFGVYTGVGPKCICEKLAEVDVQFGRFVGFDSFTGLPPEAAKIAPEQMEGDHWKPGAFSAADTLGEYNRERLLEQIRTTIAYPDTVLVPGMFEDSLTEELAATMRPAMFVDIDCDLYISARQCLEWMAKHKLWFPGTVVRYDDWKGTPEWEGGESLAHKEVSEIYNLEWERIRFNVFVLSKLG